MAAAGRRAGIGDRIMRVEEHRDLLIREADRRDDGTLKGFWAVVWPLTYGALIGPAGVAALLDALAAADLWVGVGQRTALAFAGGCLVGTAVTAERGAMADLWGMYVDPTLQRTGIGTALLRYAAEGLMQATELQARVLEPSLGAIAFYRRAGFVVVSRESMPLVSGCNPVGGFVMSVSRAELLTGLDRHRP